MSTDAAMILYIGIVLQRLSLELEDDWTGRQSELAAFFIWFVIAIVFVYCPTVSVAL